MNNFLQTYGEGSIKHITMTDDPNVLDKALNDKDYYVREAVASHPNATKEHLDKAIDDKALSVRRVAAGNPNYKKFYPNGHQ